MHFRPRLLCEVVYAFRLGGLHVGGLVSFGWIACKWYFVCVGLRGKILRSVVGAVPVCPPVSPHKGASIVKFPTHNACILGMETPLRGRSGGHTGTAPTVSFGQIARGWLMSFGQVARGMGDFVWMDCAWVVDVVWEDCA